MGQIITPLFPINFLFLQSCLTSNIIFDSNHGTLSLLWLAMDLNLFLPSKLWDQCHVLQEDSSDHPSISQRKPNSSSVLPLKVNLTCTLCLPTPFFQVRHEHKSHLVIQNYSCGPHGAQHPANSKKLIVSENLAKRPESSGNNAS